MQSTTLRTPPGVTTPADLVPVQTQANERRLFALLGTGVAAVAMVVGVLPHLNPDLPEAAIGEVAVLVATLIVGAVFVSMSRVREAWLGTRLAAAGMGVGAAFQLAGWAERYVTGKPLYGDLFVGSLGFLLLCFLAVLGVDFIEHIQEGRAELLSDILLVSTLTGAAEFLLL